MEYTVIGDPHITHKSLDRAEQLFNLVEELGRPSIWLGDFLDTKEVIRGRCLNAMIDYFRRSKLQHYVKIGNHDWFNLECEAHSLEALKLLPNVKVIDTPEVIDGMLFIPYIHDRTKLEEVLTRFSGLVKTVFGHLEVSNFDFGNGHICTTGITLDKLAGFKRVISGHFHKYQESGNLTYLGTPFSHSFGETNQTKYIGRYDSEKDELELTETPFPKHLTVEINCDETDMSGMGDAKAKGDPRDFYRIILTGSQQNIDKFPRHVFDQLNVKWITRPSDDAINNISIDETASNEAQFSRWATEIRQMDEETVQLGMSILEACK